MPPLKAALWKYVYENHPDPKGIVRVEVLQTKAVRHEKQFLSVADTLPSLSEVLKNDPVTPDNLVLVLPNITATLKFMHSKFISCLDLHPTRIGVIKKAKEPKETKKGKEPQKIEDVWIEGLVLKELNRVTDEKRINLIKDHKFIQWPAPG